MGEAYVRIAAMRTSVFIVALTLWTLGTLLRPVLSIVLGMVVEEYDPGSLIWWNMGDISLGAAGIVILGLVFFATRSMKGVPRDSVV